MKLNNLQKNFYIFFSVIVSILVVTLLWEKINLPLNNTIFTKELLALKGYNPADDTIRYIFFITFPLLVFLFLNQKLKKKTLKVKELIFEKDEKITNYYPTLIILAFIFIIFIFLEFFSVNYSIERAPNYRFDAMHDGTFLVPANNYLFTKNFWKSTFLVHGGSDLFYPLLTWKIFGVQSIGVTRTFAIFLVLFVKLLSVLLAYQFTKILNLNRESKILFFTIFTSILIAMSNYNFLGSSYYISHKDIYIILFLIFFVELFIDSKLRSTSLILICLIATFSILFQIDKGAYINFILIFYFFYLFFIKKYKDILLIFLVLFFSWVIVINLIGFDEFKAYLDNTKMMILSMDVMHGLKYPEPFFSMGENPDGARATRGLLMQITAGLFILNYLISDNDKMFSSKKIFFIFLFLLSFIMYKNALGRSDGTHIRDSHDLPVILNSFFILNYLLIFIEKRFLSTKTFFSLSIVFLLFYYTFNHNHYDIHNIKNFKKDFTHYINLEDEIFLYPEEKKVVNYYRELTKEDNCITNISYGMDAITYLLKKPSCTKYWTAWLTSPISIQKKYINELDKIKPKYILYDPGLYIDGLQLHVRIELLNSYILSNYKKYDEIEGYTILEKK